MSSPSRTVRGPRLALPKPVTVAAAVVVLPALMAVLAVALTMLTRMLVEREQEPALHWPTFWVWFVLCTGGIAVPMIVAEIRRDPDSRHPTPPAGSRLTLTVQEEEAGPVTRVALAVPGTPAVSTLVRAHELAAADVGLMEQLTSGTSGLGTSRGDTHELNAAGLALLAAVIGVVRIAFDYPETALQHRQASLRYAHLRREVETVLGSGTVIGQQQVATLRTAWSGVEQQAPGVSARLRARAVRDIERAEADRGSVD